MIFHSVFQKKKKT